MNHLDRERQLLVLDALVKGMSQRAAADMTGVNRGTVSRHALLLGQGAQRVHDRVFRSLNCPLIQVDELYGFVGKKPLNSDDRMAGEGAMWTFIALDANSRAVLSFHAGKRDGENTLALIHDVRCRLVVMPTFVSDGWQPYETAIEQEFGRAVNYAQLVKNYKRAVGSEEPFVTKRVHLGLPDLDEASTSYVERFNGTLRHFLRRMTRKTCAFSRQAEHHRAALALTCCFYNLCHYHRTLRQTPGMSLGVTDHIWDLPELLDALTDLSPAEPLEPTQLAHRVPRTPARVLPGDHGFLRGVPSTSKSTELPPSEDDKDGKKKKP